MNRLALWSHSAWLAEVGVHQKQKIEERIRVTKLSPEDGPWAPWRPSTRAWRERRGTIEQGLLWDTGELLDSVSFEVTAESVSIGTSAEHGHFLQEGTSNMVARPYAGWSGADESWAEATLVAHLNALLL